MMTTSEERLKILKMIEEGKISAEEGTRLLAALGEGVRSRPSHKNLDPRNIRVRVTDTVTGKSKASVRLPINLVDAGLKIAASFVPDMGLEDLKEAFESGMTGKVVDIFDEEDCEHIEIYIE